MKKTKKTQPKKKEYSKLPVQKRVEEQHYSEAEGLPADDPLPDYPFKEEENMDEIKKEEEDEYELYYS